MEFDETCLEEFLKCNGKDILKLLKETKRTNCIWLFSNPD